MNFAGQPAARLNHDQVVYDTLIQRALSITIFSPLVFFAADVHLRELETILVDGRANPVHWKVYVNRLQSEWGEYILYVRDAPNDQCLLG